MKIKRGINCTPSQKNMKIELHKTTRLALRVSKFMLQVIATIYFESCSTFTTQRQFSYFVYIYSSFAYRIQYSRFWPKLHSKLETHSNFKILVCYMPLSYMFQKYINSYSHSFSCSLVFCVIYDQLKKLRSSFQKLQMKFATDVSDTKYKTRDHSEKSLIYMCTANLHFPNIQ